MFMFMLMAVFDIFALTVRRLADLIWKLISNSWNTFSLCQRYSVCSLVVPTLEEAILTSVLKKNFK